MIDVNTLTPVQRMIYDECLELAWFLIDKNTRYGNSVLEPIGIMAKNLSVETLINARQDDKLSRLKTSLDGETEDPERDFVGYHILKRVHLRIEREKAEGCVTPVQLPLDLEIIP